MIYTSELQNLVKIIITRNPVFQHINENAILIMGKFDKGGYGGAVAVCNCSKLKGNYGFLDLRYYGKKIKYSIEFSFPRFMLISPQEKLKTIIHELYHISPTFDGTLRKFRHGKAFDNRIENITDDYIENYGIPEILKIELQKVSFIKWKKRPRYSKIKTFYDEKDIMVSKCDMRKHKNKFKYVYKCPFCEKEFF